MTTQTLTERVIAVLERAGNGLKWYRDNIPAADSQADDEMMDEIAQVLAALADQPGAVAAKNNDVDRLLRQIFLLCEAVEDLPETDPKNEHERGFDKGRRFQAKQIRRAMGDWFQWTFCGSSFMGEPVLAAAPTEAKPATQPICEGCGKTIPEHDALLRCKAEATQQASGERKPYAYAVYFPDQPTEELVHALDELLDDMTNREHTITELFAALSTPAQQDAVDAERWRDFRTGKALTVKCKKATVMFGPNPEADYPDALDSAIDAAISAKKGGA